LYQDLSDDELELLRELHKQGRADLNEATCFIHGASRKAVPDETLRRMSTAALVCADEQRLRDFDAERLGGRLEASSRFELRRRIAFRGSSHGGP
jgi:hypothetical protein